MTSIEPQQQLEFLSKIQRLLGEGQFTATDKYALLLAIADICVEDGEDSAAPFEIETRKIAEKFISYYWPQVRPYAGKLLTRRRRLHDSRKPIHGQPTPQASRFESRNEALAPNRPFRNPLLGRSRSTPRSMGSNPGRVGVPFPDRHL